MNTKEYFSSIRKLKARINAKEIQIQTLRELATNASPSYSGMPHDPPKTTSPMADAICKALDMEADVERMKKDLLAKEVEAMNLIAELPGAEHQNILVRRYIRLESWEEISRNMFLSLRSVYRLNNEAIDLFDNVLEKLAVRGS